MTVGEATGESGHEPALGEILAEVRTLSGHDLTSYRHSLLERRLSIRMAETGFADASSYLSFLRGNPGEAESLAQAVTIQVSRFFRNSPVYEVLEHTVLAEILARKSRFEIRVWSAGCGTGEEAYSVAILLHRLCQRAKAECNAIIFATDVHSGVLQHAALGRYPRERLLETKLGIIDEYFRPSDGFYEVLPSIRKMVHFARLDLTSPEVLAPAESIFGGFDLVLCRNVLIYFEMPAQLRIHEKLYRALAPEGYLVLGDCEALPLGKEGLWVPVDAAKRLFRKK